jgi:hypothetical protein
VRARIDVRPSRPRLVAGAVLPLKFSLEFEEYRRPSPTSTRRVGESSLRPSKACRSRRAANPLDSLADQRLASYVFWNGTWRETQHDDFEDGRLKRIRFRCEPEECATGNASRSWGFRSALIWRSFWLRTSDEGPATQLGAELDPASEGLLIPENLTPRPSASTGPLDIGD